MHHNAQTTLLINYRVPVRLGGDATAPLSSAPPAMWSGWKRRNLRWRVVVVVHIRNQFATIVGGREAGNALGLLLSLFGRDDVYILGLDLQVNNRTYLEMMKPTHRMPATART